jgi:hypothetical protein
MLRQLSEGVVFIDKGKPTVSISWGTEDLPPWPVSFGNRVSAESCRDKIRMMVENVLG